MSRADSGNLIGLRAQEGFIERLRDRLLTQARRAGIDSDRLIELAVQFRDEAETLAYAYDGVEFDRLETEILETFDEAVGLHLESATFGGQSTLERLQVAVGSILGFGDGDGDAETVAVGTDHAVQPDVDETEFEAKLRVLRDRRIAALHAETDRTEEQIADAIGMATGKVGQAVDRYRRGDGRQIDIDLSREQLAGLPDPRANSEGEGEGGTADGADP